MAKRAFDFVTFGDGHWAQLLKVWTVFDNGMQYYRMRLRPTPECVIQYNIQRDEADKEGAIIRDFPILNSQILAEGIIDQDYEKVYLKTREYWGKLKIIGGDKDLKEYFELLTKIVKTKTPILGALKLNDDPQTECKFFIFSTINNLPTQVSYMVAQDKRVIEDLQRRINMAEAFANFWQEQAEMAGANVEESVRKWKKIVDTAGTAAYIEPSAEESVQEGLSEDSQ